MRVMSEWADIYLCGDWGVWGEGGRSATCLDLGQGDENNCFVRSHYKQNMWLDVTMWPITRRKGFGLTRFKWLSAVLFWQQRVHFH